MPNPTVKPLLFLALSFPVFLAAAPAEPGTPAVFPGLAYPVEIKLPAGQKEGAVLYGTPFSLAPAQDYDTLLLQGEMPDPAVRIDIEVKSKVFFLPDPAYRQTGFRRFANGRFWARYKIGTAGRQPLRLVVVNLGLKTGSTLTIYEGELAKGTSMREEREPRQDIPFAPGAELSLPEDAPFTAVRRAQWQAAPPREPFTPHAPRYFTLHHTQAHYPKTYDASVAEIQFIQDFHKNGRGWNDIGYHFLIDPFGTIFEGRPLNAVGAHVKYRNTGNIGISFMGNHHPPVSNPIAPETVNSFVTVGRYLKDTYSVDRSSFYAHRDIQSTDCPGDDLYARMEALRGLIFDPLPVPVLPDAAPAPTPAQSESLRGLLELLGR